MNQRRNRLKAAIAANTPVAVLETQAMGVGIGRRGPVGNFTFYMECSNLLDAIARAARAIVEVRELRGGLALPRFPCWLKYVASCRCPGSSPCSSWDSGFAQFPVYLRAISHADAP